MFAEKQKLVQDLEAFGPGGAGKISSTSQNKEEEPSNTENTEHDNPEDKPAADVSE